MNIPFCIEQQYKRERSLKEIVALAYLWETTPVLGTEALPMYADDEFRLPGAPWIKTGENFFLKNEFKDC